MTLHDIPTRRLQEVVTPFTRLDVPVVLSLYTREGMESIEVMPRQIKTELAIRNWRSH